MFISSSVEVTVSLWSVNRKATMFAVLVTVIDHPPKAPGLCSSTCHSC